MVGVGRASGEGCVLSVTHMKFRWTELVRVLLLLRNAPGSRGGVVCYSYKFVLIESILCIVYSYRNDSFYCFSWILNSNIQT